MTSLFYPNVFSIPISLIIPDCLNVQSGFLHWKLYIHNCFFWIWFLADIMLTWDADDALRETLAALAEI